MLGRTDLDHIIGDDQEVSLDFCRNRKGRVYLSGLFLELTRQFYATDDFLYSGIQPYDPNGECPESTAVLTSGNWVDDENVRRWPAIIIDIGDLRYQNKNYLGAADYDLEHAEESFYRTGVGSVVWAHRSKSKTQAENYADNTHDIFDGFSSVIRADFCFEKFELRAIVKPRLVDEKRRDWECSVQADFSFEEGFVVKQESQKLKRLVMTAGNNVDDLVRAIT